MHRFVEQKVYNFSEFQEEIEELRAIEEEERKIEYRKKYPEKPIYPPPPVVQVEINSADTSQWKKLKGIGSTFANRICKFRNLLGGFHQQNQLLEVYGLDSVLYLQTEPYLILDASLIQQTNVNTASIQEMKKHPYISYYQARAIVQFRKQHGNYQSLEELLQIDLIEPSDFRKIAPYLKVHAQPKDSICN